MAAFRDLLITFSDFGLMLFIKSSPSGWYSFQTGNRQYYTTPNLKQASIDHYGCSTLQGFPVAGNGGHINNYFEDSILLNQAFLRSTDGSSRLYFTVINVALI